MSYAGVVVIDGVVVGGVVVVAVFVAVAAAAVLFYVFGVDVRCCSTAVVAAAL